MTLTQKKLPAKLSVSFSKESLTSGAVASSQMMMTESREPLAENGRSKEQKYLMKNMSAQMNRYGSILEKQRKRVQSSAMLKQVKRKPSRKTLDDHLEVQIGNMSPIRKDINTTDISVNDNHLAYGSNIRTTPSRKGHLPKIARKEQPSATPYD